MDDFPIFEHTMHLESPDLEAAGMSELLAHPDLIIVQDNPYDSLNGAPIMLVVERHIAGRDPSAPQVSLTLDELVELRNILNEAIIHVERSAA